MWSQSNYLYFNRLKVPPFEKIATYSHRKSTWGTYCTSCLFWLNGLRSIFSEFCCDMISWENIIIWMNAGVPYLTSCPLRCPRHQIALRNVYGLLSCKISYRRYGDTASVFRQTAPNPSSKPLTTAKWHFGSLGGKVEVGKLQTKKLRYSWIF